MGHNPTKEIREQHCFCRVKCIVRVGRIDLSQEGISYPQQLIAFASLICIAFLNTNVNFQDSAV